MLIKRLEYSDRTMADNVFRNAFGHQMRYQEPDKFAPGFSLQSRFTGEPDGIFGSFVEDELVAVAFCSSFGSIGVFGPAAVKRDLWGAGLGQKLLQKGIEYFHSRGISKLGLTTFPDSPKHVSLYQKYGFYPRYLIASFAKKTDHNAEVNQVSESKNFSSLSSNDKASCLAEAQKITGSIYDGLSFNKQIELVDQLGIGETIGIFFDGTLSGFAICHFGPGAEIESSECYIKHAAVRPGSNASSHFNLLLSACAAFATRKQATKLFFGINTGRREALNLAQSMGYRIESLTVAMHKPDEPFADRSDVFQIDDWR